MRRLAATGVLLLAGAAQAQPAPALRLEVTGPPVPAVSGARPGCGTPDWPDAPARAVRLATGEVRLYAASLNRVESGPDLLHLHHRCLAVEGADDPAALGGGASVASPWTPDGRTVWAVVRGHGRRPDLCPSRRHMDCWRNALTAAVSRDGGQTFQRAPGRALVAALPYRHDQLERGGRHGDFSPSNIVTLAGAQYMFASVAEARAQRNGNCLLRTTAPDTPEAWRGWDGSAFGVAFVDPYAQAIQKPEAHVCAPVEVDKLRWPVTGLVRHAASGLFIAVMQNGARGGGVFYATSPDLLHWSAPALLLPAVGLGASGCADPAPAAYPSLLDPAAADRNFETVGVAPVLFATRLDVKGCRAADRELVRWDVRVAAP